jgi:putative transposase
MPCRPIVYGCGRAAEYKVHPKVLRDWKALALKGLPSLFEKRDDLAAVQTAHAQQLEDLYAHIGRLTTQLGWIKKKLASSLTRAERRVMIEPTQPDVSLTAQADILSLSRSSLYYKAAPPSAAEVAAKHRIDEKTARAYMKEMGLLALYPGPNLSKPQSGHRVYPYLLRGVSAAHPNHIWGSDITYIRLRGGWMFLMVVLDWFSRYIVSWTLDDTLEMPFVLEAANDALGKATPQIWNTDQGSQFTSPQFTQLVAVTGAQISMDGKGRALDNIFTERLWRTIKYDHVYLHDYESPRQCRQQLGAFLTRYNEQRLHESLKYRTPAEVYFQTGAVCL